LLQLLPPLCLPPVRSGRTTSVAPENLAAARQLIRVLKDVDQFNAKLPTLIVNLKPMIVQNRPEIEKQTQSQQGSLA
jgi:hypothetical protein